MMVLSHVGSVQSLRKGAQTKIPPRRGTKPSENQSKSRAKGMADGAILACKEPGKTDLRILEVHPESEFEARLASTFE